MNTNCWYPTTKLHSIRSQETSILLGHLMMLLQLQGVRQDGNEKDAVWAHFSVLSQLLFGETE